MCPLPDSGADPTKKISGDLSVSIMTSASQAFSRTLIQDPVTHAVIFGNRVKELTHG